MIWYAAAIVVLLLSWIFQLSLLSYAMYALLAVLGLSRYLAKQWAENVTAERECNRSEAEVGDVVAVVVTLRNKSWLPVAWMLTEDLLPREALVHSPPRLQVEGRRIVLAMLRGRRSKSLHYQLTCNRRGYYQIGPLLFETGDLFGLHRRHRVLADPHFLLVFPKIVPLEGYDVSSKRPVGEVRMTYRLFEDPTRIAGVRRYEQGDALNRVHWRATARTGTLQSKVYEPSTVSGATLLVDFHTVAYDPRHEPFRSELAITAAASIANALYTRNQQVGLVTNGRDAADRIRTEGWSHEMHSRAAARQATGMVEKSDRLRPVVVETRRGPEQMDRISRSLARLELSNGLSLSDLIRESEGRLPRDATVIAVVPTTSPETVIALSELKRRGFAVTALLNIFEDFDFSEAAVPLLAAGVDVRHLKDEQAVGAICRRLVLR